MQNEWKLLALSGVVTTTATWYEAKLDNCLMVRFGMALELPSLSQLQ